MAKRANGGGETVLEGRHLLAVFFAIVVLSAVFFTLGYVLGRMQGESRAGGTAANARPAAKPSSPAATTPAPGSPSDLSFYETVEKKEVGAKLASKPSEAPGPAPTKESPLTKADLQSRAAARAAGVALQVAALLRREDAESMAEILRHKKYPVVVVPPSNDQFYRVQVGPFPSEQVASQMRKRLANDGFKVITKR